MNPLLNNQGASAETLKEAQQQGAAPAASPAPAMAAAGNQGVALVAILALAWLFSKG